MLNSFREMLLRKTEDESIQNFVQYMDEELLIDLVAESLEKMARASHKGTAANMAMRDLGVEMDPELEPHMIHSALSHHISRYKSALHNDRSDLANQHAKQVFRLVDMADQIQKHSHGKLSIQAVSPHAWERNSKTKTFTENDKPVLSGRKKPGQFVIDTKGWRHRGSDYSFLQQAPHESYHNEIRRHGHNEAYPIEQIRVNGKYAHIEDIPADQLKGFESHPFDHHPIMEHFEIPSSKRTQEHDEKWLNDKHSYYNEKPHIDEYFDKHHPVHQAEGVGKSPADKVHKPVDNPLDIASSTPVPVKQAEAVSRASNVRIRKPNEEKSTSKNFESAIDDSLPDHVKNRIKQALKKEPK